MLSRASGLAASCTPPYISTGTRFGELSLADNRAIFAATECSGKGVSLQPCVPQSMCIAAVSGRQNSAQLYRCKDRYSKQQKAYFIPSRQYPRLELVVVAMNQKILGWHDPEAWALSDLP